MKEYILMLEPDADDRYIASHFFQQRQYPVAIEYVYDTDQLLACLHACGPWKKLPALILVNLYAGPMTIPALIQTLKQHVTTAPIPVIVLSGNKNPEAMHACYSAGAASFVVKPDLFHATDEKILNFFNYWFRTVELTGH
jgi:CheY-like chemotaxis protein